MIDFLFLLSKRKKLIIINLLIVFIISIIISLTLTKWYKSTALILPPPQRELGFNTTLLNLPFMNLGFGGNQPIFTYLSILKSRSIKEKIINEFNLIEEYQVKDIEKALEKFQENIRIDVTEEGAIALSLYDTDPVRARDMTVRYYQLLDSIYTVLSVDRATNNRKFLESRVAETRLRLSKAEEKLRDFQIKYGIVSIPDQIASGIKYVAELEAKKMQLEIQYNYLRKILEPNSSQLKQIKLELQEYINTLQELKQGQEEKVRSIVLPPLSQIPDISLQYYRLFRDVEIYNKVLEFLIPQYESARLEEAKKIPNVQILDYPSIPLRKAKPKRAFFVLSVTFLFFVLLVTYIIIDEKILKIKETNSELYSKITFIVGSIFPFKKREK